MAVKVGSSYVSESALSYAQSQVNDDSKSKSGSVLNSLSKQYKNVNFSAGTQPFNGKGTNNISISPNILRQMADNPEKRLEYEALIYDCQQELKTSGNRPGLSAQGFIIGSDGGLRKWSISKGDDGKKTRLLLNMTEEEFKQRLSGRLPDKKLAKNQEINNKTKGIFDSVNDLNKYLRQNFDIVKKGLANISSKYLRDSLTDSDKQKKLFENLQAADNALKSHEGEIGFQGMTISIDEDGEMTMTSSKATVTFNESKRAAQLAAAKSVDDIHKLMKLLQEDLEDCENGLQNNMCDEAEVEKVKKMIERAQSRMNELSATESDESQNNLSIDVLI